MITFNQYAGAFREDADWTIERQMNAQKLLAACCSLEVEMARGGVKFPDNPATHSGISGQTLGGFRPQACTIGAPKSAHKEGRAVDRYDPDGKIDEWCMAHLDRLAAHGIWIEHPSATHGWSHWSSIAPKSGNRVFYP